jgi:leader peptidase (prepilin peptidase)/N-methyltransferase
MPSIEGLLAVLAVVWGAVWGSFLNVVIYRLPRGQSVLHPPSHCPGCNARIAWYQNIPVLSYIFLGGRCGRCREAISIRYPLVELTCAALALAVWRHVVYNPYIPSLEAAVLSFVFLFFFVLALTAITFIDLEHLIIPNVISLPSVVVGVAFSAVFGQYHRLSWLDSVVGAAAGALVIALVIGGYYLVTRRQGMGWGDAKLMAMLGAFLGWKSLPFILLAGSAQGIVYALASWPAMKAQGTGLRLARIPFGPFLALAGMEWLFFSDDVNAVLTRWFAL